MGLRTLVFNAKVRKIDFIENLSLYNDYEKGKKIACNVCDDYEEIRDIIPSCDIKSSNKHNLLETFKRAEKRVVILSKR